MSVVLLCMPLWCQSCYSVCHCDVSHVTLYATVMSVMLLSMPLWCQPLFICSTLFYVYIYLAAKTTQLVKLVKRLDRDDRGFLWTAAGGCLCCNSPWVNVWVGHWLRTTHPANDTHCLHIRYVSLWVACIECYNVHLPAASVELNATVLTYL